MPAPQSVFGSLLFPRCFSVWILLIMFDLNFQKCAYKNSRDPNRFIRGVIAGGGGMGVYGSVWFKANLICLTLAVLSAERGRRRGFEFMRSYQQVRGRKKKTAAIIQSWFASLSHTRSHTRTPTYYIRELRWGFKIKLCKRQRSLSAHSSSSNLSRHSCTISCSPWTSDTPANRRSNL